MSAPRPQGPGAALALAVVLIAGLAGLVLDRRGSRIQEGRSAYRCVERLGHLENEIRWREARLARLLQPAELLLRAGEEAKRYQALAERFTEAPPRRGEVPPP